MVMGLGCGDGFGYTGQLGLRVGQAVTGRCRDGTG
jgi:hypothetical protein